MNRLPCTFKEAKNVNGVHIGYRCTFDLLLVESVSDSSMPIQPYVFTSAAESIDNALMARECGLSVSNQLIYVLVTPTQFPALYKMIHDYVSQTNNDKEC